MRSFSLVLLALLVSFLGTTRPAAALVSPPLPSVLEDRVFADEEDEEEDEEDEGGW
jgi:hypothetical protein